MSEYDDVARAISTAPDRYQTRSGRTPDTIRVKGARMKGWEEMTLTEARERFHLPAPKAEREAPAPKVEPTKQPAPPPRELEIPRPVRARSRDDA